MVDECLAGDERIKKFRKEERAGKDRKRLEREEAEKRAAEDARKAKEEEEQRKKDQEVADKAEKAEGKKAKEAAKNAAKKNKRVLKASIKDANYLLPPAETATVKRVDEVLGDVDAVIAKLDNDELAALARKLGEGDNVSAVWREEVVRLQGAGRVKEGDVRVLGG